jgi:hypothetical protein
MRLLASIIVLAGCTTIPVRFAARPPMTVDTDTRPVSVGCHVDRSKQMTCAPRLYTSPWLWDRIDKSIFERISRALFVAIGHEAVNANSLDEVPASAWFTDRIATARRPPASELSRGACTVQDMLSTDVADGAWLVDHGKDDGGTPGFRVSVPDQGEYLLKIDEPIQPERASAASVIGAAIYHAAGFNTTCEQVVYIRRAQLRLRPGLHTTSNFGERRPFDGKRLDEMLATAPHRGGWIRMQASKWLPGYAIGPFRYEGTRADDPNDVVAHDNRRELRGSRLLAAWLGHWDSREQNTLDTWIAVDARNPRSSPGYVRHYILDTSDSLGQRSQPRDLAVRQNHAYEFDPGQMVVDFITGGALQRPWDRARIEPAHERFGYFSARDFDPTAWKGAYPNPAFVNMTERDAAWMARIIARFTPQDIRAIVAAGQFSDPSDANYITHVLVARQHRLLARYLTRLSPLADVEVVDGKLCATDLARRVLSPSRFHYSAVEIVAGKRHAVATIVGSDGVCVAPPPSTARERRFELRDGVARPLEVYTYEQAGQLAVAGLRRL